MNIQITPGPLSGTVCVPPSKSIAHRALICAALAGGTSVISPVDSSKDMDATIGALRAMGAAIVREGKRISVTGISTPPKQAQIDCIESGSTLRFLIPVAAALGISCRFTGSGRLPQRPLTPYVDTFLCKGVKLDSCFIPANCFGQLEPGAYQIPGDVSSQFITGLLFALPILCGDSVIFLSTPLESAPYIDLTIDVLRAFGIQIFREENRFVIPGGQRYQPQNFAVESDYSNAAFFLTAAALGSPIKLFSLSQDSLQGDREILSVLSSFGASPVWDQGVLEIQHPVCRATQIFGRDIPDLLPILCVAATAVPGQTVIHETRRLKIKESDRAAAITDCLTRLGAKIREEPNALVIDGGFPLHGARVSSYGDHRIAMSMAIAAGLADAPVVIEDAQAVEKSYPGFFADFQALGGVLHVV
ncbi:MAG: 3-phosphoshikimate 1-carboxyvinyltransferase [Oscillospiraceae bacterium]|nr:3-phosphoshikimate 1-carboxyvinyltransferase [Oscillospiraceae bacterium]